MRLSLVTRIQTRVYTDYSISLRNFRISAYNLLSNQGIAAIARIDRIFVRFCEGLEFCKGYSSIWRKPRFLFMMRKQEV